MNRDRPEEETQQTDAKFATGNRAALWEVTLFALFALIARGTLELRVDPTVVRRGIVEQNAPVAVLSLTPAAISE